MLAVQMAAYPRGPVLLVEDHDRTRDAVEGLLSLQGYAVVTVTDGQEALDYLQRGGPACLIVLDPGLPRLDGWLFRERQLAESSLAGIPVVVFSGDPKANPLPGAGFVRKTDPAGLLDFIDRHCLRNGRAQ
jgi:CheY-like chemotaxis protein